MGLTWLNKVPVISGSDFADLLSFTMSRSSFELSSALFNAIYVAQVKNKTDPGGNFVRNLVRFLSFLRTYDMSSSFFSVHSPSQEVWHRGF